MGRLIVFEGTDGSGKATQTRRLTDLLDRKGMAYRKLDFPRYKEESSALVRLYLGGAFGTHPDDVNAYAASTFFAVDRFASYKQDWGAFYNDGGLIVTDRYTTSNVVHQAAKLPGEERKRYADWLFQLEYDLMGLPSPDMVVYLDMDPAAAEKLMRSREAATGTSADIHERDEDYLRRCRDNALEMARYLGWNIIECARDGEPRTIEEIGADVISAVSAVIPEIRDDR